MTTLYQMLHGGFTPPEGGSVRRYNPDKRMGNGAPVPERPVFRKTNAANTQWFVEFNRQRHLKLGAENRERVLAALLENPGVTTRQLAVILKASVTMANTHLQSLVASGQAYKAKRSIPRGGMEMLYFPK